MRRLIAAVVLLIVCATEVHAQFDVTWLTFAEDTSRLRGPTGAPAGYIANGVDMWDMASGDLDQNGWTDLVVVRSGTPLLLMNESAVLFDRTQQLATDSTSGNQGFLSALYARSVIMADINGDGWLDVLTSEPRIYVNKRNDVNGNWLGLRYEHTRLPATPAIPVGYCRGLGVGDVDGQNGPDLYLCCYFNDFFMMNDGTGSFTDTGVTRLTSTMLADVSPNAAKFVDMNGDGWKDIVRTISWNDGPTAKRRVSIAHNDPTNPGFFPMSLYVGTVFPPELVTGSDVGDLNNDGLFDIAAAGDFNEGAGYATGVTQGITTFTGLIPHLRVAGLHEPFNGSTLVVDLDRDGWNDVVQSSVDITAPGLYDSRANIYHNPGGTPGTAITLREEAGAATGNWLGAVGFTQSTLAGTWDAAAFDLDNDTDVDLVLARHTGLFVWMNQQVADPVITSACFGDGTDTACPCAAGNAGRGCPSSQFAAGAQLTGAGAARILADTFTLVATDVPNSAGMFIQGSTAPGLPFGDGLLCVGGGIDRLGVAFRRESELEDAPHCRQRFGSTCSVRSRRRCAALSAVVSRFGAGLLHAKDVQPDERGRRDLGSVKSRRKRVRAPLLPAIRASRLQWASSALIQISTSRPTPMRRLPIRIALCAPIFVISSHASAQVASALLRFGDAPIGAAPGVTVSTISGLATNEVGGVFVRTNLSTTSPGIWGASNGFNGVLLREAQLGISGYDQTAFEGFFGGSELGALIYSPTCTDLTTLVAGLDTVWADSTPFAVEGQPIPTLPGKKWRFASRPGITGSGIPYWVGGISDIATNASEGQALFQGTIATPVLKPGDPSPAPLTSFLGASVGDFDARFSRNGTHYINTITTTDAATADTHIVVGRCHRARRRRQPAERGPARVGRGRRGRRRELAELGLARRERGR
jgi:hypothetical protein